MRGLRNFSSDKLPKRAFREKPLQLFKQQAFKTSISCEAPATFQATSFQNEDFVRGLRNFSSDKLPKRAFRARLPQLFKQQASKTSISCEASETFQATSFQNEHFVRGFPNFFKQQASKTSVSCEASPIFRATSFQNEHFLRGLRQDSRNNFASLSARPPGNVSRINFASLSARPAARPERCPEIIFLKTCPEITLPACPPRPPARERVQK